MTNRNLSSVSQRGFQIIETGPGPRARVHLGLIRAAVTADRLLGGRGLGYVVPRLRRLFGSQDYLIGAVQGGRLKLSMNDAYWMTPLMRNGCYEPEIDYVLRRTLRADSAFVDCGANIGYWSVLAAGLIGLPNRVLAIEANHHTAARLRENAVLNEGSFRTLEAAVWSKSGDTIEIAVDAARHSWSSADPQIASSLLTMGFSPQQVETITIDDAAEEFLDLRAEVIVLKIDVEGSEEEALAGAERMLRRDTLVIYEEHGRSSNGKVTSLLLHEFGMDVFDLSSPGGPSTIRTPQEIMERMSDKSRGYNLCGARPGSETHRRLSAPCRERSDQDPS